MVLKIQRKRAFNVHAPGQTRRTPPRYQIHLTDCLNATADKKYQHSLFLGG